MITIRISFLLAFPLLNEPNKNDSKSNKDTKADKKSKSNKSSGHMQHLRLSKAKVIRNKPKYVIEVESPIRFLHIEYGLIRNRPKYQIDVLCWGPIAKVFSEDDDIILKTFVKDNLIWVPFSAKHILNNLNNDDLVSLHQHIVDCTIWTNKNKLGGRAKAEKCKIFFIREENVNAKTKFVQAYDVDPNSDEHNSETYLEKEIKNIIMECADKPGTKDYNEIVTHLEFVSDPLHAFQINRVVDSVDNKTPIKCKECVPICPPPLTEEDLHPVSEKLSRRDEKKNKSKSNNNNSSNKSDKSSKKDKSEKTTKGDASLKILMSGEALFTEPNMNIYELKATNAEIQRAFVIISVSDLMTRVQKYNLNPMVIKIHKIYNLPVEMLNKHRFKEIYACYNIPYIAQCSTTHKSIQTTIDFNEAHAHFTDSVPKLKLLEFIQTQRLYVEIRAVRDRYKKSPKPNLFGFEKEDKDISKLLTTNECIQRLETTDEEPSIVTIAIACYDISSLLSPTWIFKEDASCHHPGTMLYKNYSNTSEKFDFIDTITLNEINLVSLNGSKKWNPLSESILQEYGTTLKIEVHLSAPCNALLQVQSNPEIYNRLFFITDHREIAMHLLNMIMVHNQNVLGPEVALPNFLKWNLQNAALIELSKKDWQTSADLSVSSSAVTGFVLDNGNSYAFFIEGLANELVADIWTQIRDYSVIFMKTFYDNSFAFERRLYPQFLDIGGVYMLFLQKPLMQIVKQQGIYLEGNVPVPCWEAIKKLTLLLKCLTLGSMIQYRLFPTARQLLSLGLEFGVPFKWNNEKSIMENSTKCIKPDKKPLTIKLDLTNFIS